MNGHITTPRLGLQKMLDFTRYVTEIPGKQVK